MKRARTQRGLSLVEATIILLSLMVLGSVLAPSIKDYVDDARMVKVKEDCEAIGLSIARLMRDVGPCIRMNGALPCTVQNRADLLVSEGHEVEGYAEGIQGRYAATSTSSGSYVPMSYSVSEAASDSVAESVSYETETYVTDYVRRVPDAGIAWKDVTVMGGSTAFHSALSSPSDLTRMVETQGLADDIRAVLRASGISGVADGVIAALQGASASAAAPAGSIAACGTVDPPVGSVVECQLPVGETLYWMAYRPGARKGNRAPGRLHHVRWAGKDPVRAFAFRVEYDKEAYTFVVPALCANLSLISVADIKQRVVTTTTTRPAAPAVARSRYTVRQASTSYSACVASGSNAFAAVGWHNTPRSAGLPYGHSNVDYLENQLIRNWPSGYAAYQYAVPSQFDAMIPGPRFGLGWRGAYLSAPIGDDPWGHKYFVNTMFLYAFGNNPTCEGYSAWASDTFCLSAGANGWVETPFASYGGYPGGAYAGGTVRGGDDFVYVIAGGSR